MAGLRRLVAVWLGVVLLLALLSAPAGARVILDPDDMESAYRAWEELARYVDTQVLPVPEGTPVPISELRARGAPGWASFREPFPAVPVWNPPGTKRVGLQAGHWLYEDAPDDLAELRTNPGAFGGGMWEWEVNLDIAERTAAYLRAAGVEVDILPSTVPVRYRAHAFITIHADGDTSGSLTGYKVARPLFSSIPDVDDALVEALNSEYGSATGLERQDHQVSRRMTMYYAFNARRYQHAVAPGVPQAIIETGFLTSMEDRQLLIGDPDSVARGIANGVLRFLDRGRW